ncbi:MAG: hypothetical protein ACI8W8_003561 [Rhodothermales bacterium]|jgi:hypothetical protein
MSTVLIALAIFIALVMMVLIILLLIILSERLRRVNRMTEDAAGPVFDALNSFFTAPERELVHALGDCLGKRYRIFGKVSLSDMVIPADSLPSAIRRRVRGRAERRRVDVVICRSDDFSILGAIEVVDAAAVRPGKHVRSGFLEDALSSAGIPYLRIPAEDEYDLADLAEKLGAAFGFGDAGPKDPAKPVKKAEPVEAPAPTTQPVPASPPIRLKPKTVAPAPLAAPEAPTCGDCGSDLIRRVARAPDGNTHTFMGCTRYPECSFVQPMGE